MKWQRCEGKGKHGEEEDGGKDDGGNLTMPTVKVCQSSQPNCNFLLHKREYCIHAGSTSV